MKLAICGNKKGPGYHWLLSFVTLQEAGGGQVKKRLVKESSPMPQLPALVTDPHFLAVGMKSPSDFGKPKCSIKQHDSVCLNVALSHTLVSNCGT